MRPRHGPEARGGRGFLGLVSEQSLYNLTARTVEREVVPACEAYGLGLIPYSPLAGGLLGGPAGPATAGRRSGKGAQQAFERHHDALEAYTGLCGEIGERPADVALAWLLHNRVVTAPIIGPRTAEQLDGALRALDITLPRDTLTKLDAIFPGPGGAAPEAYAW